MTEETKTTTTHGSPSHQKHKRHLSAEEKKLNIYRIIILLLIVILIVVLVLWARNYFVTSNAEEQYSNMQQQVNTIDFGDFSFNQEPEILETESEEDILELLGVDIPEKNLEWESLKQTNKDIYAWIYIPDTNIDYPILQHPTYDTYYLDHNLDGSKGYPGCLFTQMLNSKEFDDYNTVIYGHNMKNGSMFRTLHYFEDESFFSTHPFVYVYTEDKVLVYEVFAAYTSDNSHILNTNDFSSEAGYAAYLNKVYNQARLGGWYRDGVSEANRIITLSTCTSGKNASSKRFLVQAVLLNGDLSLTMEENDTEEEIPEIYDPFTGLGDENNDGDGKGLHKITGEDLDNLEGEVPLKTTGKE